MNIGLLGFGVVGRGVYDMLAGRDDIRAAWVLCRRDLGELTAQTTYEMQDILDDPAVDTVVEVMGGLHPAYEYVAAALRAGCLFLEHALAAGRFQRRALLVQGLVVGRDAGVADQHGDLSN